MVLQTSLEQLLHTLVPASLSVGEADSKHCLLVAELKSDQSSGHARLRLGWLIFLMQTAFMWHFS